MEITELFEKHDLDLYEKELPRFIKKYAKLSKRMDKILKQGDRQQLISVKLSEELEAQKNFINSVINSQSNIVISTDGIILRSINTAFNNFFNVTSIDEFVNKFGSCICDTFDKNASSEYLQKFMGEDTWINYVLNNPNKIHKAKILRNDIEYIFTITADTFMNDSEELKVAVFNDISDLEKTRKNLETTNSKVNQLLNNAGQGFLYFDLNMIIGPEYSKEASIIFDNNIHNKNITKLLYPNDNSDQLFLESTLKGILNESEIRQEILISLLQKEFFLNDKYIEVEYKILDTQNFMMILTDITSKKELALQIKEEQQVLKMVVEIVTSLEQFIEIKTNYINLILGINDFKSIDKLIDLRREIHTYKGLFAQKEMLNIVKELHEFESSIDISLKQNKLNSVIENINYNIMNSWIEEDIKILKNILGDDFFSKSNHISIDRIRIGKLQARIKLFVKDKQLQGQAIPNILKDIEELKFNSVETLFHPYKKLVEQLSIRLEKNINPLVLKGQNIYIGNQYKSLINSLVHIFRNSVDHGIESENIRLENNKKLEATISCEVQKSEECIKIIICDDGAGINIDTIKQLALSKEIYTINDLNNMNDTEIVKIIFHDNFSTSDNITDISGRGVGLASVMNELNKLHGSIDINNIYTKGITFTFTIPIQKNDDADIELLKELSNRTISYYNEYLGLKLNNEFTITEVQNIMSLDKSVVIPLTNDMDGIVYMSISNKHAEFLINDYLDDSMSKEDINEISESNLAELLNITLGNILKDLSIMKNGGIVGIKTPNIINKNITKEENSKILLSKLKYEEEDILLGYFI